MKFLTDVLVTMIQVPKILLDFARAVSRVDINKTREYLILNKVEINFQYPCNKNRTVLHIACETDKEHTILLIGLLLKNGADVTIKDDDGKTPLDVFQIWAKHNYEVLDTCPDICDNCGFVHTIVCQKCLTKTVCERCKDLRL